MADVCELLGRDVVVYASGPPGVTESDARRGYPVVRAGHLLAPTPGTARRAVQLLHQHRASRVVFGAASPLGLLAPILRRAGAERIVGLTHGHEIWWAQLPGSRSLLRRIGDGCDHLTTISDFSTDRIAAALSAPARERLLRLAPPVDLSLFRPGAAAGGPGRCVAVGRFVVQKGFSTLIRAWRAVQDRWPAAAERPELVVVGDGPQRVELCRLVSQLGLEATVRMTGALPRSGVLAELQAARVFALPVRTRWAGLNPEGLGLAAVEAAACGLPVVVGRSGGAPETVRDGVTGFVVDPARPADLAGRIATLLLDPVRAAAMGAAGRRHVAASFGREQAQATLLHALEIG